jgi:hypothetical protein
MTSSYNATIIQTERDLVSAIKALNPSSTSVVFIAKSGPDRFVLVTEVTS